MYLVLRGRRAQPVVHEPVPRGDVDFGARALAACLSDVYKVGKFREHSADVTRRHEKVSSCRMFFMKNSGEFRRCRAAAREDFGTMERLYNLKIPRIGTLLRKRCEVRGVK